MAAELHSSCGARGLARSQRLPARVGCMPAARLLAGGLRSAAGQCTQRQLLHRHPLPAHRAARASALPRDDGSDGDLLLDAATDIIGEEEVDIDELAIKYLQAARDDPLAEDSPSEAEEPRAPRGRGRVVESVDLDAIALDAARDASGSGSDDGSGGSDVDDGAGGAAGGPREYRERPERRRGLPELLAAAGYAGPAAAAPDLDILDIVSCNSDSGGPGSLFVCVPCEETGEDGHDWADQASELGAVAVLAGRPLPGCLLPVVVLPDLPRALGAVAAEFFDSPSTRLRTVALVGSYGKTTTAWLARGLLEEGGQLVGMSGNTEHALGEDRLTREGHLWVPDEEDTTLDRDCAAPFHAAPYAGKYELPGTTPDALHLQKLLAGMADRGAGAAVVEVCPTLAADGRADALRPEVLVFTNVAPERAAADPGGADAYVERIAAMFERLQPDQTAVINVDDPNGPMLARLASDTGAQVLTFAAGPGAKEADVSAEKVKATTWETEVLVRTPVGRLEIILPLVGRFNVGNVLAAVGVGLALGVKLVSIVGGIEAVDIVPGRCELVDEGQPFPVIVDAAATPEQLSRLIDDVKEAGARRTLLVVGCPGSAPREHRAAMGSMAHFKADLVFLTNDSPGGDLPDEIISDMASGFPDDLLARHSGAFHNWLQDPHRVPPWFERWLLQYQAEAGRYVIEDRFSAIRVAVGMARSRDVVLVTGRGHLDYVEYWDGEGQPPRGGDGAGARVSTRRAWFDDRVECRNTVTRLPKLNKLKDLDRNALPWTRYPEERESMEPQSGVAGEAGRGSGQYLDQYLRSLADPQAVTAGSDDEEDEDEEEVGEAEDEDDVPGF